MASRVQQVARPTLPTITGGSDYHGPAKPDARIGRPRVPASAITGDLAERYLTRP